MLTITRRDARLVSACRRPRRALWQIWLWPGPDPLVEYLGRLLPGGVLRKPLGVLPVLVVAVAVPVNEPDDRDGLGRRLRDRGPEAVVDALLIDVGLITGVTEREDAKTTVGLVDETALDPLDGVGVGSADGDAAVEVVSVAWELLLLNLDQDLARLVVLARCTFGLFTAFRLFERLLPQAIVTGPVLSSFLIVMMPVLGPLLVIVTTVCCGRLDRDPGQHERPHGQGPGPDGDPVVSSEHGAILESALSY